MSRTYNRPEIGETSESCEGLELVEDYCIWCGSTYPVNGNPDTAPYCSVQCGIEAEHEWRDDEPLSWRTGS